MTRRAVDTDQFLLRATLKPDAGDPGRYPLTIPAVRDIGRIELHPKVTFLVGENGSGKSTIVEALAVLMGMNAEGGSENFNFTNRASHSGLADMLRPVRGPKRPRSRFFLRAESYFNLATNIEQLDDDPDNFTAGPKIIDFFGGRSLHEQSHGESFMALMLNRFGADGLYILDEPEAALSPTRQLAMMVRMHQLIEEGSQFIIATHAPILMTYPDSWLYEVGPHGAERVDYKRTDHFRVALDFLRNPEQRLHALLDDRD